MLSAPGSSMASRYHGDSASSMKSSKRDRDGVADKFATHVPDIVLQTAFIGTLPYSQKFEGLLLFADISGRLNTGILSEL